MASLAVVFLGKVAAGTDAGRTGLVTPLLLFGRELAIVGVRAFGFPSLKGHAVHFSIRLPALHHAEIKFAPLLTTQDGCLPDECLKFVLL